MKISFSKTRTKLIFVQSRVSRREGEIENGFLRSSEKKWRWFSWKFPVTRIPVTLCMICLLFSPFLSLLRGFKVRSRWKWMRPANLGWYPAAIFLPFLTNKLNQQSIVVRISKASNDSGTHDWLDWGSGGCIGRWMEWWMNRFNHPDRPGRIVYHTNGWNGRMYGWTDG